MNKPKPKTSVSSDTEKVRGVIGEPINNDLQSSGQQETRRRNLNVQKFKPMRRKGQDQGQEHGLGRNSQRSLVSSLKTSTAILVHQSDPPKYQADMAAVTTILHRLITPDAVQPWLNRRLPALGRRKPVDVIRKGDVQRVIEILTKVEEGIHI